MTKIEAHNVGKTLSQHKNEWVILDSGNVVAHAPKLKDAVKRLPKDAKNPRIYYSATRSADMVLASF